MINLDLYTFLKANTYSQVTLCVHVWTVWLCIQINIERTSEELSSENEKLKKQLKKISSIDQENIELSQRIYNLKHRLEKTHQQLEQCKQEREEVKKKLEELQTELAVKTAQVITVWPVHAHSRYVLCTITSHARENSM